MPIASVTLSDAHDPGECAPTRSERLATCRAGLLGWLAGLAISEHVSLAVAALAQVGGPARERIAEVIIARASTCKEGGTVRIPGVARCIAGTK
jgi:hypothetical protein